MAKYKVKESNPISFRLDTGIVEQLDAYSKKSLIPKTRIVEQALREYLEKMNPTET